MPNAHLLRVGVQGIVGRYLAEDGTRYPRGARVIVRTGRGLETGEVLSAESSGSFQSPESMRGSFAPKDEPPAVARPALDGSILRGMTIEDDLLDARLKMHRAGAIAACERLIEERGLTAVLLDVEPLFDGATLVFYFLGGESEDLGPVLEELAGTYESRAEIGRFAETLAHGCGPDCGAEKATGCGTTCSSCAVACGTKKPSQPERDG